MKKRNMAHKAAAATAITTVTTIHKSVRKKRIN